MKEVRGAGAVEGMRCPFLLELSLPDSAPPDDGKAASAIPQEDERVIEGEQGLEQGYEG